MKKILLSLLALVLIPSMALANPVVSTTGNVKYLVSEVDEETHYIEVVIPPGFNVNAKLKGNVLTLTGVNNISNKKVVFSNYKFTSFEYNFKLKAKTQVSKLSLSNGILKISVMTELPADQKTKTLSID